MHLITKMLMNPDLIVIEATCMCVNVDFTN